MIEGLGPVTQSALGTLFTWGLTALGAGLVFVFHSGQRKILDGSLGFAAGVMTAASYWSLLAPAIEMAETSGLYGAEGEWAFVPVAVGFTLGAVFVYTADIFMPYLSEGFSPTSLALSLEQDTKSLKDGDIPVEVSITTETSDHSTAFRSSGEGNVTQRRKTVSWQEDSFSQHTSSDAPDNISLSQSVSWKRIVLLIVAITIHNIPEGLAVGVGFGAIGKSKSATFENARNLAFGIGIQNFPEGLAVSLPLHGAGMSKIKSFWYGQLSGMVEPIAGILGSLAVSVAEPILPYALAFAAGAMIYVVMDDILPEAQVCGNGKLASWGGIVGFVVMMSLDVGLG